jgi:ribosomal protein S6
MSWILTIGIMANYEMMLIMDPALSEEDRENNMKELRVLFKDNSVKIEREDIW